MSEQSTPSTNESDNVELDPQEGAHFRKEEDALDPVVLDDVNVEETNEAELALATERDQYRDALQHLQADFENFRKRTLKQQAETGDRATEQLVSKLLPVLDTIDLAKAHDPNGSLEQVATALLDTLTKEGLERIAAIEEPFDPNLHEAVAHEPGDGGPRVSEEMRAGYRWKGRVLRPAMVKVVG